MEKTGLPEIPASRGEIIRILSEIEYGFIPPAPEKLALKELSRDGSAFASKALLRRFELDCGGFALPFDYVTPREGAPVFLCIAFSPDIPNKYLPAEEIIDAGFGIANLYYEDAAPDRRFGGGLADIFPGTGKISLWAWAASRVMDALERLGAGKTALVGHSRLGKTALWCGGQDERFSLVISNDSGCAGAALFRGKGGEDIAKICDRFPFWFCEKFGSYAGREGELPFDQHWLLSLTLPRRLIVSSAADDAWADPAAERRCLEALGRPELTHYHLRPGSHFLSRTDWLDFMAYRRENDV